MTASNFAPVVAASGKELELAMQRLWLTGRILPVGARLLVRHVFRSAEPQPVEVVYAFALPRDAALRRFRVNGDGFSVRSELRPTEEALKLYERGIEEGHLSTLARQYADGLVNLSLGNLRPGETVTVTLEVLAGVEAHDDGFRFRFPFTLAPSYHAKARAATVEPGTGEMELPEDEFGDLLLPRFAADASGLHEVGFDLSIETAEPPAELGSPSHSIRVAEEGGHSRVALAPESDVPDRDLVLDVGTGGATTVLTGLDRNGDGRFAAIVPSARFGPVKEAPRRVVFVLDRSGSMNGTPLKQARKAVEACLGALAAEDRFGLVAFDDKVEAFGRGLAAGTMENREKARRFLESVGARGGTELARAVEAAAKMLGGEQGDLLVLTDGQVFGTEAILETARKAGARLHCLGIGSASQDRFLALLARETGGVCRFLTPRERVDLPAVDLFASIGQPAASDVRASGDGVRIAPPPSAHVFAGTPLVLFGQTAARHNAPLRLEWNSGSFELPLAIGDSALGETLRLVQGARLLTDLESRPKDDSADREIERLSNAYGLASRRMALVAVVERAGDRAGEVPVTRVVPVGMPSDTEFQSYFGSASLSLASFAPPQLSAGRPIARAMLRGVLFSREAPAPAPPPHPPVFPIEPAEVLLEETARIEPDGGLPGPDRTLVSARLLLELITAGNTVRSGPFRRHVRRLAEFLERGLDSLPQDRREMIGYLLAAARRGGKLPAGAAGALRAWTGLDR